jgi:hypothetical protein
MSEKKAYPLRINAEILAATQRWADDELRSLNAQIEVKPNERTYPRSVQSRGSQAQHAGHDPRRRRGKSIEQAWRARLETGASPSAANERSMAVPEEAEMSAVRSHSRRRPVL